MGVHHYLEKLSSSLVLTFEENERIKQSVKELKTLIEAKLPGVQEHFTFGSYVRGTKLSLAVDPNPDVDYLIVFNKGEDEAPIQLIKQLRDFVLENFPSTSVIRTVPTCIVEVKGILLELIPAFKESKYLINYSIPSDTDKLEWIPSVPNEYNNYLVKYDSEHDYYIIPLILILKYCNIINDYVYSSYILENELMFIKYPKFEGIFDYFEFAVNALSLEKTNEGKSEHVVNLRQAIKEVRDEASDENALHLLSTLLPYI